MWPSHSTRLSTVACSSVGWSTDKEKLAQPSDPVVPVRSWEGVTLRNGARNGRGVPAGTLVHDTGGATCVPGLFALPYA
jgi:hypothetical protein